MPDAKQGTRIQALVSHLRGTSETILLILVVLSPWAFGCVHPFFRYLLTAGVCALLLLWAFELFVAPRDGILTRFQIPLICLLGIVVLQLLPLGGFADWLSPTASQWKEAMLPSDVEVLADGQSASVPIWTARERISLYPAETLRRGYWLALMCLVFTRVQDLASPDSLRRLCLVCLINGSVLAYFSVFQHFFTSESGMIYWTFQSMGAAFGPFINRNHFAFYTNICFGLSLGLVGSRQMGLTAKAGVEAIVETLRDSVSLWMMSVLVFMLGAVILCSSRGGMISLVGSSLITTAFIAATGTFRQGTKWFLLAALLFGGAAAVQVWLGFDFVDSRYTNALDDRTPLWIPLLDLVGQFPLTGSGLGTLPWVEPSTRPLIDARDYYLEYAHNEYLQAAVELGIPGLLCGCALLVLLCMKIARRIRKSRHNAWLYVGLLFSMSSIALHSFTEFGLAIPAIAFLGTIVLGHIAGLGRVPKRKPGMLSVVLSRAMAVVMIPFVFFAFRDAKLFDLGERSLLAAQRAHNENQPDQELEHYLQALRHTPNDLEMLLEVARLQFEVKGDETRSNEAALRTAQQLLVRTRELCPISGDAQFFLGRNAKNFASADEDLRYYQRALRTRPNDPTLAYIAGLAYIDRGDEESAIQAFRRSLTTATRHLGDILGRTERDFGCDFDGEESANLLGKLIPDQNPNVLTSAADWLKQKHPTAEDNINILLQRALATSAMQSPTSGEQLHEKARLLGMLGESDQQIDALSQATRYEPANSRWRIELVELLRDANRFDEADRQLRRLRTHRSFARLAADLAERRTTYEQSSGESDP